MLLSAFPVGAAEKPGPQQNPDYIIGAGDVLYISVWKDEALTGDVVVLPDGSISFPLVGSIPASGKTVAALKKDLEESIKRYVPEPVLTVAVKTVNSMFIYVIGRVNNPGRFVLNAPINVLQALSMAGGVNPFADNNDIKIMRSEGTRTTVFKFRYNDVSKGKNLEQNITLKRGDVIIVP
jgi:polysaccharide export outer membrane protein